MPLKNICSYIDCRNSRSSMPHLSFHRFPKKESIAFEWINRSGNDALFELDTKRLYEKRLCSEHFDKNGFLGDPNRGNRKLKQNALPHVFWHTDDDSTVPNKEHNDCKPACSTDTENSTSVNKFLSDNSTYEIRLVNSNPPSLANKLQNDRTHADPRAGSESVYEIYEVDSSPQQENVSSTFSAGNENTAKECSENCNSTHSSQQNTSPFSRNKSMSENKRTPRDPLSFTKNTSIKHNGVNICTLKRKITELQGKLDTSRKLIKKLKRDYKKSCQVTADTVMEDASKFLNENQLILLKMQLDTATKKKSKPTMPEQKFATLL